MGNSNRGNVQNSSKNPPSNSSQLKPGQSNGNDNRNKIGNKDVSGLRDRLRNPGKENGNRPDNNRPDPGNLLDRKGNDKGDIGKNIRPDMKQPDRNGEGKGLRDRFENRSNNSKDNQNANNIRDRFNKGKDGRGPSFRDDPKMDKLPTFDRQRLLSDGGKVDRKDLKGKRLPKFEVDRKDNKDFIRNINDHGFKGGKLIARDGDNRDRDVRFNGIDRVIRPEKLDRIANIDIGRRVNLGRQFDYQRRGDLNRRLDLTVDLRNNGGWRNRRHIGGVHRDFTHTHFSSWYAGPGFYPRYTWTPRWSNWVSWSWWDHCYPICDPRPIIVRPIICEPAPAWTYYETPVWQPLPVATSGTWVDVPPAEVASPNEVDVQLLAVRFVDSGHVEKELGPRYRVWVRNNSSAPIEQGFNVTLLGSTDDRPVDGLPQEGVRVERLEADEVTSVDIRLPFEVNVMGRDEQDRKVPFSFLHVIVDSGREVNDVFRENNGIGLNNQEILPIDPWAFAPESDTVPMGSIVNIAGEGFGPEPGELFMVYEGEQYPAEIYGWYDLGIRFQVPNIPIGADDQSAEILVIRGDGAASNPIEVDVVTEATVLAPPVPGAQ
ncbi:hypothetical protein [Polystyrenella longa]|uniref:hypothetical protein n=1 Tax=Polystyrenella longa TaxID=2528007 RepID=UPI0011A73081|nr:hypothetical protein [Polystyrenella longa]